MSSNYQSKPTVVRTRMRSGLSLSLLALLPILMACESADSTKTVGQKIDNAVARTEQAAIGVKDATKASIESASTALREGAAQAKVAAQSATDGMNFDAQDAAITASVALCAATFACAAPSRRAVLADSMDAFVASLTPIAACSVRATAVSIFCPTVFVESALSHAIKIGSIASRLTLKPLRILVSTTIGLL